MSFKNTKTYYGRVAQFFHWLIFLLVATTIPLGFLMGTVANKEQRSQLVNTHKLIGVSILILMLLRLLWALTNVKPGLPFQTPNWQRLAERSVHFVLYAGLIIMPLSGLIGSVAAGHPPHLGDFVISLPISQSKTLPDIMFDYIHNPLAFILIGFIVLHIVAALYHHFIKRDDVLRRMLVGRTRR